LTSASRPLLAEQGFLSSRGAIHIADSDGVAQLRALEAEFIGTAVPLDALDRRALESRIPGLRPGWRQGLAEPSCADIDVAGLHAFYLAAAKQAGVRLITDARVERVGRSGEGWELRTKQGTFAATVLVDAAGAWADGVAVLAGVRPLGIRPFRRTMVQLRTDPPAPAGMPLIVDSSGRFYFKPEAGGRLWVSPHDETPCEPCDCAPEELDVAIAIDRFEQVVDWRVERVEHSWAGLRSFAPDRLPVYGFAPDNSSFFWFAGQGGFGIQTAPAAAKLAAALLREERSEPSVAAIDPAPYSPARFAETPRTAC
jgi:D-arginine dehydrogenase